MWITASASSRGFARSPPADIAASSCCCGTPTMRASMFLWNGWTWFRVTAYSKARTRRWTNSAAPFGAPASRAALKAVIDNKQIAVLAPTTVLTFQHFETFKKRFAAFPARIEMLSRFRSAAEQKKILADLEAGKVDVVIGTHRLLSKDVKFADLGLLIVDEEQRFGVAQDERLKNMRKNVDALALSATPIPRTLHMTLVG